MTTQSAIDRWRALPWKKFQKVVFRLQVRIFKARKRNNSKLVLKLQKLLLNSKAAKYLAVRQVTQLNQGKATAGIDGKKALTEKERLELADKLEKGWKTWKHQKLRRLTIPKKDGTQRKLGIPTISDRAYQCLIKYALEPASEATFHGNSYGFRPSRSAHDVQKRLFLQLSPSGNGASKHILEMDIEKCFDRIDHDAIMNRVQLPERAKIGLRRAIKAGVRGEFPTSSMGTPQGGVISPLLANIALNGIESCLERIWGDDITCLRYADDLVFISRKSLTPATANVIISHVGKFLEKRGLQVKASKTKLVKSTEGFDFLGWNFKVKPNGKFISTPSKESRKKVKVRIKEIMKDSRFTLEQRIDKCGALVRGWRNYHRYCDMTNDNLWAQNHWTWKYIRKQGRYDRQGTNRVISKAFPTVAWKVNGHVNVKGDKSVFDGDLIYWAKRSNGNYTGLSASLLKEQGYKCKACQLSFLSDDKIELHHIDGNHENWKKSNLEMLHRHCHQHKPIHGLVRVARKLDKNQRVDID